jgi:predicted TIM-barrel enzyme
MPRLDRQAISGKLQAMKRRASPLLAVARGRAFPPNARRRDLIFIYNSGRYRVAGRVSLAGVLAHRNANEIVRDMAREVLAVVKHSLVLAGVNGTDPFCLFDPFLDDLKRLGFSGVQNFPMVGLTTESSAPIQKRQACPTRSRSR